jgi:hypothetical protein
MLVDIMMENIFLSDNTWNKWMVFAIHSDHIKEGFFCEIHTHFRGLKISVSEN